MAQKLKFGNGTWATKKGSTLAYNDQGGNFKPLPFTTTRDSIATRVNKEGLIEVVGNDVPRIDYTDSSDGVLLLENSATNLITQSQAFDNSYWTKTDSNVTSNSVISPDGTLNADKLVENTQNTAHIAFASPTITLGNNTFSVFAKAAERRVLGIEFPSNGILVSFDLIDGVFVNQQANPDNFSITPFLNGWYRIDITENLTSNSVVALSLRDENGNRTYQGDGTSGVYIWGAMLEQGSYSTSYIPTFGSTVQRAAETASGAGNSEVFNDSEGVLFADSATLVEGEDVRIIGLSDGSTNNRISITYHSTENRIQIYGSKNGTIFDLEYLNAIKTDYNKVAVKYNSSSVDFYYNGFLVDTVVPSGMFDSNILNSLNFDRIDNGNPFYGKTKEIGYYDTALTDEELEYLTSYRSLNELVTELNLNEL
jgi:hypothetical protein